MERLHSSSDEDCSREKNALAELRREKGEDIFG